MSLLLQRSMPLPQQTRIVPPVDGPTAAPGPSKTKGHSLGYVFGPIASTFVSLRHSPKLLTLALQKH